MKNHRGPVVGLVVGVGFLGCGENDIEQLGWLLGIKPRADIDQVLDALRAAETSQALVSVQLDSLLKMRKAA